MPNALIDTDILIDYLRAHPAAIQFLEGMASKLAVSALSITELYAGAKANEIEVLTGFISILHVFPVTDAIAKQAGLFKKQYGKSHGTGLADALIAATAAIEKTPLYSLNTKHYPMFAGIKAPYKK